MFYEPKLIQATLKRRYKRFLADVIMPDGAEITVHCPNTGSMRNCITADSPCWLFDSANPKRKYRYSLEHITTACGAIAGINSARANKIVVEAIENKSIDVLSDYASVSTEVPYGVEKSRIDIMLTHTDKAYNTYIEVKSVTLKEGAMGYFPDAVTTRGQKHLRELTALARSGERAVLFFCVQHSGISTLSIAAHIDKKYADLMREAVSAGVEVLAFRTELTPHQNKLAEPVEVLLT